MNKRFYKVIKINLNSQETLDYGIMNENDMKSTTQGYKSNGMFYERSNGRYIFIVEEAE